MITLREMQKTGKLEAGQKYLSTLHLGYLCVETGRFNCYKPVFEVMRVGELEYELGYQPENEGKKRSFTLPFNGCEAFDAEDSNGRVLSTMDVIICEDDLTLLEAA